MMTLPPPPPKYLKLCFVSNLQQIYVGVIIHPGQNINQSNIKSILYICTTAAGKGKVGHH